MKIITEKYVTDKYDFEFWSGAKYTVENLTDEQFKTIMEILEETEEYLTDTQLNDFFWFEDDTIAEWLGFDSFEELIENKKIEAIQ